VNSWRCADCWFIPYELETDPRPCPRCGCVAFTNGTMHITLKLPMARMTLRRRASGYLSKLFANGPTKDDH
jgi:hypothetical protein